MLLIWSGLVSSRCLLPIRILTNTERWSCPRRCRCRAEPSPIEWRIRLTFTVTRSICPSASKSDLIDATLKYSDSDRCFRSVQLVTEWRDDQENGDSCRFRWWLYASGEEFPFSGFWRMIEWTKGGRKIRVKEWFTFTSHSSSVSPKKYQISWDRWTRTFGARKLMWRSSWREQLSSSTSLTRKSRDHELAKNLTKRNWSTRNGRHLMRSSRMRSRFANVPPIELERSLRTSRNTQRSFVRSRHWQTEKTVEDRWKVEHDAIRTNESTNAIREKQTQRLNLSPWCRRTKSRRRWSRETFPTTAGRMGRYVLEKRDDISKNIDEFERVQRTRGQITFIVRNSHLSLCYRHLPICLHSLTFDVCSFSSHSLPLAIALFPLRFVRFIREENEYTKGTSHIWRRDPFASPVYSPLVVHPNCSRLSTTASNFLMPYVKTIETLRALESLLIYAIT